MFLQTFFCHHPFHCTHSPRIRVCYGKTHTSFSDPDRIIDAQSFVLSQCHLVYTNVNVRITFSVGTSSPIPGSHGGQHCPSSVLRPLASTWSTGPLWEVVSTWTAVVVLFTLACSKTTACRQP